MFAYLLMILSVLACCQGIFLGTAVENITDAPYMALIYLTDAKYKNKITRCAGSIIDEYNILTSCLCLNGMVKAVSRIGSIYDEMGGQEYEASSEALHCHPEYDNSTFANNIGLISFPAGMDLDSNNAKPVKLAEKNTSLHASVKVQTYGWGSRSVFVHSPLFEPSPELQYANISVIKTSLCKDVFIGTVFEISDQQFCAGPGITAKPCSGDNGGPAMLDDVQVGVFSVVYSCGDPVYPAVYTRVSEYYDWIQSNVFQP